MKKRSIALLLAFLMLFVVFLSACGGETKPTETTPTETTTDDTTEKTTGDDTQEETAANQDPDTLVVGSPEINGDWINGFGNSSYDAAIKSLIGTYGTYYSTYGVGPGGDFILDQTTNAKEPEIRENEDGSKTYKFFLNDKLVWNDGTPITAKDYVFSVLFAASPEWLDAGAGTSAGSSLLGYAAYHDGSSKSFPGVKYIDDTTFEVTIDPSELPYFYEAALVSVGPDPMHRYTPNLDIGEDGSSLVAKEGYEATEAEIKAFTDRIENNRAAIKTTLENDLKAIEENRAADAEVEDPAEKNYETDEDYEAAKAAAQKKFDEKDAEYKAVLDEVAAGQLDARDISFRSSALEVAQVFRFKPDVTCGPYNFVSFENQTVTVTLNDKFLGNYEGKKPTIKNVVQKQVNQNLNVDLVISGDIDISPGEIEGEKIEKAKAADTAKTTSYPRNGYGMIAFHTDLANTKYKEVRQAVAYLMDRNVFVQNVLGGYGVVVNGEYGLSEWMYADRGEELEEKLNHYTLNIDKANELLNNTPFLYEKDGKTPWDPAKAKAAADENIDSFDYYRYNDKGEQLVINHFGTVENNVTDTVAAEIPKNGKYVGLLYNVTFGDFATLLNNYYNPNVDNPVYTAFNLATSFAVPHDPYYSYHSSQIGNDNTYRVNDPKVDEILVKMRNLDGSEREKYLDYWEEFQLWWNDYMPCVPLYSNEYYDIYSSRIEALNTTPVWMWYHDIVNLKITQ